MYDPVWVCRDGKRMKVGEMDIFHLIRSINKIERSRRWRKEWLPRLYLELDIRRIKIQGD